MTNTIKVERAKLSITQEQLAQKIHVSRQTIHSIEINKFIPSTLLAIKIARIFNLHVEDLFILDTTD